MADPTKPFRAGTAGIVPPPDQGFHKLIRGLRNGEAQKTAERLREPPVGGHVPEAPASPFRSSRQRFGR